MRNNKLIVFDLDDTLYNEVDFLYSAYEEIAKSIDVSHWESLLGMMLEMWRKGDDVFLNLENLYPHVATKPSLLSMYRSHKPTIVLSETAKMVLSDLRQREIPMGIITDGRSVTQRNKYLALGLYEYIPEHNLIISEETGRSKLEPFNFLIFMNRYPTFDYIYVGDNPCKDFVVANRLEWKTFGLKDTGRNIHSQAEPVDVDFRPRYWLDSIEGILGYLD